MNQPMIGLHNALTAHPAANFVGRLVTFAWRCQRPGAINRAIMQGIRFFDIRVCRHRGLWYAAHGCVRINVDPVCTILNIARRVDSPTIRLILEHGNPDDCRAFISLAQRLQATCPNVRFIGGNHKPTWKKLISFDHDNIGDTAFQCVGSMDPHPLGRIIGYLCPRLWTRLFRRTDPRLATISSNPAQLYDFLL
ncbi:hypothetical protein [Paramuribaculum intestinale]|uniref:hypothetical protein n=1 Tax=Paramuribaculum intestinale TaxID=2094151 RepID=UPI0025B73ED6|nr:hypothetical protein [Paramuribaculum intestinale]